MGRFILLLVALGLLVLVPFALWGDGMATLWTVRHLESFGKWAWLAGLGLLVGDLFLPLPSTVVMSGLGYLYGLMLGGMLAALGSWTSAMVGYGLCRWIGEPMALRLAGREGLKEGSQLFDRYGAWIVGISRCLPVLAEVIACLAGMTRMPWRKFSLAALSGCVPLGFTFAAVGQLGTLSPAVALGISAFVPPLLWLYARKLLFARSD